MKVRSIALGVVMAAALLGCSKSSPEQQTPDSGPPVAGLTAEQANSVLAKVGDRVITLGDFAKTLERMDQFDRLRYQTKERRRELLEAMIDVELLAAEAKRRGLDKSPEVDDEIRIILRDAMLAQSREGLPAPAQVSADEVRAYYEAHRDRFDEPERRRVAAIVVTDKKEALKVLQEAEKIKSAAEWGELFFKRSLSAPKTRGPNSPVELAGDLGIVGPPDDPKGSNPKVPEAVRAAAFKIPAVGGVAGDVVEAEGKFYVVRLNGMTAAHHRTLAESDRSIRVLLIQDKMQARDKKLEEELRQKYPVHIDDKALGAVKIPAEMDKWFAKDSSAWPASDDKTDAGSPRPADGGAHE